MIVAGIDPSLTNTGIAILHNGQPTTIESTGIGGKSAANWLTRNRRIRATVPRILRKLTTTPDLVVIEGILEHGPMLPGAIDRHALWHALYGALDHQGIPIAVVNPSTLKIWATGKGNAKKPAILAEVRSWFTNHESRIVNHDQADALVLALMGAHHAGDPMPFELKPRHTTGLEAVHWP